MLGSIDAFMTLESHECLEFLDGLYISVFLQTRESLVGLEILEILETHVILEIFETVRPLRSLRASTALTLEGPECPGSLETRDRGDPWDP